MPVWIHILSCIPIFMLIVFMLIKVHKSTASTNTIVNIVGSNVRIYNHGHGNTDLILSFMSDIDPSLHSFIYIVDKTHKDKYRCYQVMEKRYIVHEKQILFLEQ
jgi:hypothetical protein